MNVIISRQLSISESTEVWNSSLHHTQISFSESVLPLPSGTGKDCITRGTYMYARRKRLRQPFISPTWPGLNASEWVSLMMVTGRIPYAGTEFLLPLQTQEKDNTLRSTCTSSKQSERLFRQRRSKVDTIFITCVRPWVYLFGINLWPSALKTGDWSDQAVVYKYRKSLFPLTCSADMPLDKAYIKQLKAMGI